MPETGHRDRAGRLRAAIAQPEALDTDPGMPPTPHTGFAAKKRADHQISAIRPSLMLAPDSLRPRANGGEGAAASSGEVVAMPTMRPRRDGVDRQGALVPLDGNNRVFATKPLAALGWDAATALVAEVRGSTAVVRRGVRTADAAWLLPTRVDSKARLRLPPGVKGALQVHCGDQVVVCAVPDTGELHLSAAVDALQALTGAIHSEEVEDTSGATPADSAQPPTRVRAAVFAAK